MSSHSAEGMHEIQTENVPWLVAESSQHMASLLAQICSDRELRKRMSEAAEEYVKAELNAQVVYSDLIGALGKK